MLITNTRLDRVVEISFQPAGVVAIKCLKGRLATESIPDFNTASLWPHHATGHRLSSTCVKRIRMILADQNARTAQKPFYPWKEKKLL